MSDVETCGDKEAVDVAKDIMAKSGWRAVVHWRWRLDFAEHRDIASAIAHQTVRRQFCWDHGRRNSDSSSASRFAWSKFGRSDSARRLV